MAGTIQVCFSQQLAPTPPQLQRRNSRSRASPTLRTRWSTSIPPHIHQARQLPHGTFHRLARVRTVRRPHRLFQDASSQRTSDAHHRLHPTLPYQAIINNKPPRRSQNHVEILPKNTPSKRPIERSSNNTRIFTIDLSGRTCGYVSSANTKTSTGFRRTQ